MEGNYSMESPLFYETELVSMYGFKGLNVKRYLSLWFSVDTSGEREEEEEEGEEQGRCCQVSQQEEGEDGVSAEGRVQLLFI